MKKQSSKRQSLRTLKTFLKIRKRKAVKKPMPESDVEFIENIVNELEFYLKNCTKMILTVQSIQKLESKIKKAENLIK